MMNIAQLSETISPGAERTVQREQTIQATQHRAEILAEMDPDDSFRDESTRFGWVIGAGLETSVAEDWTIRLEGSYLDFGRSTYFVNEAGDARCGPGGPRIACPYRVENSLGLLRVVVLRRFGG